MSSDSAPAPRPCGTQSFTMYAGHFDPIGGGRRDRTARVGGRARRARGPHRDDGANAGNVSNCWFAELR
jgi:hypothetical protein